MKESMSDNSSSVIDSLRNQISNVAKFNKYRSFNPSVNEGSRPSDKFDPNDGNCDAFNSDNKMSDVAEQIRNAILTRNSSRNGNVNINVAKDDYLSENLSNETDMFSPFRKKYRNNENTYLSDKVFGYFQRKMDEDELCLYNINKLRNEMIKLNRKNASLCNSQAIKLIPNAYSPLSPMRLLNLKELTLLLSILYSSKTEKNLLSHYFRNGLNKGKNNTAFIYPEKLSITRYSTIITGRIAFEIDVNFVFSYHNSHPCRFILNSSKWQRVSGIISSELSSSILIIVNPETIKTEDYVYVSSETFFISDFLHLLTCIDSEA